MNRIFQCIKSFIKRLYTLLFKRSQKNRLSCKGSVVASSIIDSVGLVSVQRHLVYICLTTNKNGLYKVHVRTRRQLIRSRTVPVYIYISVCLCVEFNLNSLQPVRWNCEINMFCYTHNIYKYTMPNHNTFS